jgi:hypothetical protein
MDHFHNFMASADFVPVMLIAGNRLAAAAITACSSGGFNGRISLNTQYKRSR